MASKSFYELEPATAEEIDAALRPFIDGFVRTEKRERARVLFLPPKKRAQLRDLLDMVVADSVLVLDRSKRASSALAQIDRRLEGVFLTNNGLVYRAQFGHVQDLAERRDTDEELFVARGGVCGLYTFDVGDPYLIARP